MRMAGTGMSFLRKGFLTRLISSLIIVTFTATVLAPPRGAFAQTPVLPPPGTMITPSPAFEPLNVRGLALYPDNPLKFDFIINTGEETFSDAAFQEESKRLIKYFLTALTVPDDQMWVNLSPYEQGRIIPEGLGTTEMGMDMLAQDYLLKQLTASLAYPEEKVGKAFWQRVYAKAQKLYGTTQIPVNTFNKVWIVPDKAEVYEHDGKVFVVARHLKVMLEEDYQALNLSGAKSAPTAGKTDSSVSSSVVREVLLPEIEREVNEGKNFATLRQMYNAMILAAWYKRTLKEGLLGQVYMNQNKTSGVDTDDVQAKDKIYQQYLQAFKKGVYSYIREDYDPAAQRNIPRKYFSGGLTAVVPDNVIVHQGALKDQSPAITKAVTHQDHPGTDQGVTWEAVENIKEDQITNVPGETVVSVVRNIAHLEESAFGSGEKVPTKKDEDGQLNPVNKPLFEKTLITKFSLGSLIRVPILGLLPKVALAAEVLSSSDYVLHTFQTFSLMMPAWPGWLVMYMAVGGVIFPRKSGHNEEPVLV